MKLLTIVGARPQFIKASALSRTLRQEFASQVEEHLLHTGQHYDTAMSQVFFDELGLPTPRYQLNVGSGTHGWQTARMLEGIERVLLDEHYDAVLIYGDTNSTLAAALAAAKLHVPLLHVEAGLRSHNRAMPEEQNRIVADQLATRLYAPTLTAMRNLQQEGALAERAFFSGDVMLDNARYFLPLAQRSDILLCHGLREGCYALATLHRDFNTDSASRLGTLLHALERLVHTSGEPVVLPLHPRTANRIQAFGLDWPQGVVALPPVSYLDMLALESHARIVLTDSGGVQKEAYFVQRPCIILRPETEWEEIVEAKAALLADADEERIVQAYTTLTEQPTAYPPLFGDGTAAHRIITDLIQTIR